MQTGGGGKAETKEYNKRLRQRKGTGDACPLMPDEYSEKERERKRKWRERKRKWRERKKEMERKKETESADARNELSRQKKKTKLHSKRVR